MGRIDPLRFFEYIRVSKRDYEDALNSKKYLHINVIKLDSPKETKIWLENLKSFWYEGDKH